MILVTFSWLNLPYMDSKSEYFNFSSSHTRGSSTVTFAILHHVTYQTGLSIKQQVTKSQSCQNYRNVFLSLWFLFLSHPILQEKTIYLGSEILLLSSRTKMQVTKLSYQCITHLFNLRTDSKGCNLWTVKNIILAKYQICEHMIF